MSLSRSQRDQISRIVLASAMGEATEKDLEELNQLLLESPAARKYFVSFVHLQTSLFWQNEKEELLSISGQTNLPAGSLTDEGADERADKSSERQPGKGRGLQGTAPLSALGDSAQGDSAQGSSAPERSPAGFWNLAWPSNLSPLAVTLSIFSLLMVVGLIVYQSANDPGDNLSVAAPIVAVLDSRDCTWGEANQEIAAGDPIYSCQRLELLDGVAKIQFKSGTTVVVESPAVIEPITPMSMRLERGSVAVRSNGPRKDFTVISPEASVVDLGTSFGVHAAEDHSTEIEVFEGAVEVQAGAGADENKVLGLGAAALVRRNAEGASIDLVSSPLSRFDNLLEVLWDDISDKGEQATGGGSGGIVEAEFNDAPIPKTVDTFYGSTRGRGWVTPWLASGNPVGKVEVMNPLSGENNPYLSLKFGKATTRTVGREYGARSEFDPRKPHVISWRWRYDGDAERFGGHYQDRILFYGNPSFRGGTGTSLSWLIGVVGAAEETAPPKGKELRKFYPMRWAFYDREGDGGGRLLDGRDMVDTGMKFKPGTIYDFAVVVYPQEGRYDAAIRDDTQTVIRTNLAFRDPNAARANVIHFSLRTAKKKDNLGFSLDSVHIEPFENGGLRRRMNRSK